MLDLLKAQRHALALAVLTAAIGGCSSKPQQARAAAGMLDTAMMPPTGSTVGSAGLGAQVTATDGASVNKATEFKLTTDNFHRFLAAADSVAALAARDSATRNFLSVDISGSSSNQVDAGLKRLESNAAVSNAINSAGISPYDYFVASIAISDAQHYIDAPQMAPATPTGTANAEFLRAHTEDLEHLKSLRPAHQ